MAGLAQGQSINVRVLGGRAGPGPVDKGEEGRAGPGPANRSKVFWGYPMCPPSLANPDMPELGWRLCLSPILGLDVSR